MALRQFGFALVAFAMFVAHPTAAQTQYAVPDFSGIWHRWFRPGLGPSASGPGPLVNRSLFGGVSDYNQLVGDYTRSDPETAGRRDRKAARRIVAEGHRLSNAEQSMLAQRRPLHFLEFRAAICSAAGQKITMLYMHDHEIRRVRLNQSHPAHLMPSWYGDSVGHYEGDTLVIDTISVKPGPYPMLDMYGTPFSDALHVVERYRLVDYAIAKTAIDREAKVNTTYPGGLNAIDFDPNYKGRHLQLEITVDDPKIFTTPWTLGMIYGRPAGSWIEHVCAENTEEFYNGRNSSAPVAPTPDF